MRARIAASAAPSVTAGSTRCASVPVPGDRQPAELDGEQDREQRPEPEVRHRDADERERHRGVIDRRCLETPREDAERDAQ